MPKVLWSNKSPVSLERVVWLCWFFRNINLHLVRYPLKLRKFDILGWYCQAQPLSHSDCQLFWILKTQKRYEVSSCFFLPLKLEEILCYLGFDPKTLLANQFAGYFTFGLFDLLNLIPGFHYYIVLVLFYIAYFYFYFIQE